MRIRTMIAALFLLAAPATALGMQAERELGGPAGPGPGQEIVAPGVPDVVILPPTATTRTYVHVFLAFTVAFALLGGYVYFVSRRFSTLEDELRRLGD